MRLKPFIGKHAAIILGGHVNGYSIVQELSDLGIEEIWLIDTKRSSGTFSSIIKGFQIIEKSSKSLLQGLKSLSKVYSNLIVYPTNDHYIEWLIEIHEEIEEFCFLPFSKSSILDDLNKNFQYQLCKKINIPYPKSIAINSPEDLSIDLPIQYPVIVKPVKRDDIEGEVFRNKIIDSHVQYKTESQELIILLNKGFNFIISEIIPGDDTQIFAYTAHKKKDGVIANEWVGKKLNQYPNEYGVFSSSANFAPTEIRIQGKSLVEQISSTGIIEPEFKYDYRDKKYKLMEINLRPMMWHRTGHLSGVHLMYSLWCEAVNKTIPAYLQKGNLIHFIYLKHEIINFLFRPNYSTNFKKNVLSNVPKNFAFINKKDPLPFIFDILFTIKTIISRWLGRS